MGIYSNLNIVGFGAVRLSHVSWICFMLCLILAWHVKSQKGRTSSREWKKRRQKKTKYKELDEGTIKHTKNADPSMRCLYIQWEMDPVDAIFVWWTQHRRIRVRPFSWAEWDHLYYYYIKYLNTMHTPSPSITFYNNIVGSTIMKLVRIV